MIRRRNAEPLEKVRILAHPLRLRLYELFAEAPRTTKQAADVLKLPATRLYHHVAALERVGLVRVRERRRNRGTVEKHYEAIERGFSLDSGNTARSRRLAHTAAAAAAMLVVDRAREDLAAALDAPDDALEPLAGRINLIGSRKHLEAARAELVALIERLRRQDDKDGSPEQRASLTIVFAPKAGD